MRIEEIIIGIEGRAHKVVPQKNGVTVVPVGVPKCTPDLICRSIRETLSAPVRTTQDPVSFVRVKLAEEPRSITVVDDAKLGVRVLEEQSDGHVNLLLQAETSKLADDARLEVVLSRIAGAFSVSSPEDLGPALAFSGAQTTTGASPKELAYKKAYDRAAQLAKDVRALDDKMTASVVPGWIFVAAGVGGLGVLMTAIVFFYPDSRVFVVPVMIAMMVIGLVVYGLYALKELRTRDDLQNIRMRLREDRENARRDAAEFAETLLKKGADPEEVLERLKNETPPARVPVLLSRNSTSNAEVTALGDLSRQVLIFVDAKTIFAGETYGGSVRALEPIDANASLPR